MPDTENTENTEHDDAEGHRLAPAPGVSTPDDGDDVEGRKVG